MGYVMCRHLKHPSVLMIDWRTCVVDLLVHKYNCSLTEVDTVSAFVTSLLY